MLVLTRKLHEALTIGDEIQIVVVEIRGNAVRLGIVVPENIPVVRNELLHPDPALHVTISASEDLDKLK